jgi:hypothetical protein
MAKYQIIQTYSNGVRPLRFPFIYTRRADAESVAETRMAAGAHGVVIVKSTPSGEVDHREYGAGWRK